MCEKSGFFNKKANKYFKSQNQYEKLLEKKRSAIKTNNINRLAKSKNWSQLWRTADKLIKRPIKRNLVGPLESEEFFESYYLKRERPALHFVDAINSSLDTEITEEEILISLTKCKKTKFQVPTESQVSFIKTILATFSYTWKNCLINSWNKK